MSTSSNTPYAFATKQIAIYIGIPIFIFGILGGIFNIIVFLSLKTFRQNSCAFLLTIMSFVNIGQLLTNLLTRIMISGFDIDWTVTSLFFCKFRSYCLQVCSMTSYTCLCLAIIDQYMATSFHVRWQQYFTIKKAYILSTFVVIIWLLHNIPTLIWFNLVPVSILGGISCIITNPQFQQYYSYVCLLTLAGILPIIINIIFGSLAYWNVRQIPYRTVPLVRRELEKQLTTMVLVQVCFKVLVVLPYIIAVFLLNTLDLSNPSIDITQLGFASHLTGMIHYLHFASPFYIYICVSKRFRQQFIHVISAIYYNRGRQQPIEINQIAPEEKRQK